MWPVWHQANILISVGLLLIGPISFKKWWNSNQFKTNIISWRYNENVSKFGVFSPSLNMQESFCVWVQLMRDNITMQRRISWAELMPRMILVYGAISLSYSVDFLLPGLNHYQGYILQMVMLMAAMWSTLSRLPDHMWHKLWPMNRLDDGQLHNRTIRSGCGCCKKGCLDLLPAVAANEVNPRLT